MPIKTLEKSPPALFGEWSPIETAPKDGQKIIVWDAVVEFAVWEPEYEQWNNLEGEWLEPSHWMPLPSQPNAKIRFSHNRFMQALPIKIANSPSEAPNYKGTNIKGAEIHSAIIVLNGTTSGKPTVDLRFEVKNTKTGKTESVCIAMITGELIKGLASAIKVAEERTDPADNASHDCP